MSELLDRAFREASQAFADLPETQKDAIGAAILEELRKWKELREHILAADLSGPLEALDMRSIVDAARRRQK